MEHHRADRRLLRQPRRHRLRHAEVRIGAPSDETLPPAHQPDDRMARSQTQREHRPRLVVPVDDQACAADARDGERDQQRRDGRGRLHEDRIGRRPSQDGRELARLSDHPRDAVRHEQRMAGPPGPQYVAASNVD